MGLHNRYPRYFYKRGNLFNTYLGYSDDPGVPVREPKREKPAHSRSEATETMPPARTAQPAPPPANPKPSPEAVEVSVRLASFARHHLSVVETERLLRLIAAREGVQIEEGAELDWRVSIQLERLVRDHVAPDLATRYLRELNERRERGEPLIQK